MRLIFTGVWKTLAVVAAALIGSVCASQAGWSGAEGVVNYPLMGVFENMVTDALFLISIVVATGALLFVHKIAKPALFIVVPVFLYTFLITGAWNGFASDFDAVRLNILKHGYANAYAIEHMSPRGRFLSCGDERIELTDDAKSACANALDVPAGERIPGSEHRCGFLNMFGCFDTAK
jgi:hypothetical protein